MCVAVLGRLCTCKPRRYRKGPKLHLVNWPSISLYVLTNSDHLFSKDTSPMLHPFTLPSAHAPLSYLVLSPFCSPLLCSSFAFPLLGFLSRFQLDQLVSRMSDGTSRSQSQLPDNRMSDFSSSPSPGAGVKSSYILLFWPKICFWTLLAAFVKAHILAICCKFNFTLSWIFNSYENKWFSAFQLE